MPSQCACVLRTPGLADAALVGTGMRNVRALISSVPVRTSASRGWEHGRRIRRAARTADREGPRGARAGMEWRALGLLGDPGMADGDPRRDRERAPGTVDPRSPPRWHPGAQAPDRP